jgi:predicted methyltransferase MtxX (methanogen marker protein 4)
MFQSGLCSRHDRILIEDQIYHALIVFVKALTGTLDTVVDVVL